MSCGEEKCACIENISSNSVRQCIRNGCGWFVFALPKSTFYSISGASPRQLKLDKCTSLSLGWVKASLVRWCQCTNEMKIHKYAFIVSNDTKVLCLMFFEGKNMKKKKNEEKRKKNNAKPFVMQFMHFPWQFRRWAKFFIIQSMRSTVHCSAHSFGFVSQPSHRKS